MTASEVLSAGAERILRGNDMGSYTKPSPRLYPHQWNWDSAYVAIGWAHVDWRRAVAEVDTLLAGQWTNGMLPHIRYNPAVSDYSPGPEWWPDPPVRRAGWRTSGISQPPVLPSAVYQVGLLQPDRDRRLGWWDRIYESLVDAVRFYARFRTVEESPLIAIVHPWESGVDNSPRWDFAVKEGHRPGRPYRRTDITLVDPSLRPPQRDYDLYMYLVEMIAANRYDLRAYASKTPFLVYDALFNAVWYRAALDLNRIAAALGRDAAVADPDLAAFRMAYHQLLWNHDAGLFRDYDVKRHKQIPIDTASGLVGIYGGLVNARQASIMVDKYGARSVKCRLLPSVPPDEAAFEPARYWRGPVWVNLNWMVVRGCEDLGLVDRARSLAGGTLDLVSAGGCAEYFHAYTGDALGGADFSWSAALSLDLIRRPVGMRVAAH